jgi:release factor glutamine methyltransferase
MENPAVEASEWPKRRVADVLRQGAQRLVSAGMKSGRLDAEILLGHVLDRTREQLVLMANEPISRTQWSAYEQLLARRLEREPVAYITETREFWSLDFCVTPAVLIPRPETERLVEIALSLAGKVGDSQCLRIVDLGTGSGAIAVALARELPRAKICAVDLSAAALAVARRNAARHGVEHRINFVGGDLLDAISTGPGFHLVVGNPPYIPSGQIFALEPEVGRWEPRAALAGGIDGLDCYRRIAAEAFSCIVPGGGLAVEIGADMAKNVVALFQSARSWNDIAVHQDYAGNDRVVVARTALRS